MNAIKLWCEELQKKISIFSLAMFLVGWNRVNYDHWNLIVELLHQWKSKEGWKAFFEWSDKKWGFISQVSMTWSVLGFSNYTTEICTWALASDDNERRGRDTQAEKATTGKKCKSNINMSKICSRWMKLQRLFLFLRHWEQKKNWRQQKKKKKVGSLIRTMVISEQ